MFEVRCNDLIPPGERTAHRIKSCFYQIAERPGNFRIEVFAEVIKQADDINGLANFFINNLNSDNPIESGLAAIGLMGLQDDQHVDTIMELAMYQPDSYAMRCYLTYLAEFGDEKISNQLLELLEKSSTIPPQTRMQVLSLLRSVCYMHDVLPNNVNTDELANAENGESKLNSPSHRFGIVSGNFPKSENLQPLKDFFQYLQHAFYLSESSRLEVIVALGILKNEHAVPNIIDEYESYKNRPAYVSQGIGIVDFIPDNKWLNKKLRTEKFFEVYRSKKELWEKYQHVGSNYKWGREKAHCIQALKNIGSTEAIAFLREIGEWKDDKSTDQE